MPSKSLASKEAPFVGHSVKSQEKFYHVPHNPDAEFAYSCQHFDLPYKIQKVVEETAKYPPYTDNLVQHFEASIATGLKLCLFIN